MLKGKFVIDTLVSKLDNRNDKRLLYSDDLTVASSDKLFNVCFQKLFDTIINNNNAQSYNDINNNDAEINIVSTNFGNIKFTTMYDKIKLYFNLNRNE